MTTTTRATTVTSSQSLSNNDYQSLVSEIKATIDRNDQLFQQIQRANYPNAGNYSSDLLNYKIETEGKSLEEVRNQVWNYLTSKYNENSKLRNYYFAEIRKADEHITNLAKQQQDMIDSIQNKKMQSSTANQSIKSRKYEFDKLNYYLFLYKLLVIIQILILAVLSLCLTGFIPRATALVLVVIILIATLAFVGYYVFYVNIGRSAFNWAKFEHDGNIKSVGGMCADSSGLTDKDRQRAAADAQVNAIIENASCDAGTTPTTHAT